MLEILMKSIAAPMATASVGIVVLLTSCASQGTGDDGPPSIEEAGDESGRFVVVEGGIDGPATRGDWDSAVAEPHVYCGIDDVKTDDISDRREDTVPDSGWDRRQADEHGRCGDDYETLMFRLSNCEREARGLPPLQCDLRLVWTARAHSQDMADRDFFSHHSPEGATPGDRLTQKGVHWRSSGENIAIAPTMSLGHTGWMESRGHRESILGAEFTHMGLGIIKDDRGYVMTGLFTGG